MPNKLKEIIEKIKAFLAKLSVGQRIALATIGFLILFGLIFMFMSETDEDYQVVFTDLGDTDLALIIDQLKANKTPYELGENGTILVPSEVKHEVRLMLTGAGLPTGGTVGLELFDERKFGMTEFEQKIAFQRAIQGELQQTIVSLEAIKFARVHIVPAKSGIFKEDYQPAKASINIHLQNGQFLPHNRIAGITHLVSSSIEGLFPEHVTIVDHLGNILTSNSQSDQERQVSENQKQKQAFEEALEKDMIELLENIVGKGSAVVKVSADMDFDRREHKRIRIYPDEIAIRSSSDSFEKKYKDGLKEEDKKEVVGGVVGVQANKPGEGGTFVAPGDTNYELEKSNQTKNNEVGEETEFIVRSPYVKRLTVSVLVDEIEGDNKVAVLNDIKNLVMNGVGFSLDRGDKITVTSRPFVDQGDALVEEDGPLLAPWMWDLIRYAIFLIGIIVVVLLILKPLMRYVIGEEEKEEESQEVEGELVGDDEGPTTPKQLPEAEENARLAALEYAEEHPDMAARILQNWLFEDGPEDEVVNNAGVEETLLA